METIRWFRRLQLWATDDWQLHHNNVPTHASHLMQSFLVKHQITQVTQSPYSPDLTTCNFWLFPKLKSPLKRKRFQTIDEIQENTTGQVNGNWKNSVKSQGAYLEGDWGIIVPCTMFLISCIFHNCLYFSYYMAGYFLDWPHMTNVCIYTYIMK